MSLNGYENYLENQIVTADKGKLILIIYEAAINSIKHAINLIQNPPINFEKTGKNIQKAEDCIFELMCSLNMEAGEISRNLYELYNFMVRNLIKADLNKDVEILKNILLMLISLNEAWEDVILNQKHKENIPMMQAENHISSDIETFSIKI
ncbi:flagellar export chaperone FliS [Candidatus Desantisbacteria bacterium]|nr:flagellar export chaperone FliS [Candidatus Desantisbacteria bacterium]